MNPQQEFMDETFHMLAQPITVLRATLELGLGQELSGAEAHRMLADCLLVVDGLMQEMSIFREYAGLDEQPMLQTCDGQALLVQAVDEMTPVAHASGVALHFRAQAALIECNQPMLQRAIFVLLDQMIARAPDEGKKVSIALSPCDDGFQLELRPGVPPGQRQKLCRKLIQFAGGKAVRFASGCTSITFPKSDYRYIPPVSSAGEQLLASL
jgi:signal transduction histidine kinase